MLNWIITKTVHRPVTVVMLSSLVLVLGVLSLFHSPVSFYPPITVPRLTVATSYDGLPAREIRELITLPIEDTFSSLQGLRNISSSSLDGISLIELKFSWGTDMRQAGIQAREMADIAALQLPDGVSKPMVLPVNPAERPVLILGIFPKESMDITLLKRLCDREVRTILQQADGVGSIQVLGGLDEEILIEPVPSRAGTYGFTTQSIAQFIQSATVEIPAGSIEEGAIEYIIKTESSIKTASDISDIFLTGGSEGSRIRLGDIANISHSTNDRDSFLTRDGHEGVALMIRIQGGFSPVSLSDNLLKKIEDIKQAYGNTLKIEVLHDSSVMITESINNLVSSGIIGIIAAFFVLLLFLKNIPSALIMISSVPFSLLSTIALFPVVGAGINIMSIGGLAIGIGMLVDNSVVVLENIQKKATRLSRKSIAESTIEIANSTLGSTITSLIVFLPLFFLPGIIGIVFRDMAWAVCLSLLSSFIVSITVIPVLFSYFGSSTHHRDNLGRTYRKYLRMFLRKPFFIFMLTTIIVAAGVFGFFRIEKDWLSTPGSNEFDIKFSFPSGTTPDYLMTVSKSITSALSSMDYIDSFFFYAGGKMDDPYYIAGKSPEYETLNCQISTRKKYKIDSDFLSRQFTDYFRQDEIREIKITASGLSFNEVIGIPDTENLTFQISGNRYENAYRTAEQLLSGYENQDIRIYPKATRPQFIFSPKWESINRMGIDSGSIAQIIGSSVFGVYAGSLETSTGRIPVRIRMPVSSRSTISDIKSINFPFGNGGFVTINDVAEIREDVTPPVYYRSDRQDIVNIDIPKFRKDLVYSIRHYYTDINESEWNEQFKVILLLFSLSIFLMYIVLGMQFDSYILPVILLAIVPVGFAGVIIALISCGKPVSLNGILGSLVVIGIIVNNGIILYDHYSSRISSRQRITIGIYRGANDRIRAITISFLTSLIALLPVALDLTGKNPQSIMAIAIIGGLFCSNFISIFAFPFIFSIFFKNKTRDNFNDA